MKKLILFDLDGVLVNACDWHYLSLNKALKKICNIEINRADHISTYNGLPTSTKLKMLDVPKKLHKKIWNLKQELTIETISENAKIDQDKISLHEWLKSNNWKIGCVTNSIRKTATMMLELTGQLEYMDILITNEDVKKPKPNPEGYKKAIKDLGFSQKDLIYIVEDSPKGLEAANQVGVKVIKVVDADQVILTNLKEIL